MLSIWDKFPAYINLQLQIKRMNLPERITKPKELQELLGIVVKKKNIQKAKKGKKKGKKKAEDDDADDEDGDDVEDDDVEDEDAPSDQDNSDAQGPESREERAKRREEQQLRIKELKSEAEKIATVIKVSCKPKKDTTLNPSTNWADINAPWTRASRLSGELAEKSRFQGKHMWKFHTAEYGAISSSSHYRYLPTFASMILAEYSAVLNYRVSLLLYQLDGGAAYLRYVFEQLAKDSLLTDVAPPALVQSKLPFSNSKTDDERLPLDYNETPVGTLTWPDGLYNPSYNPRNFSMDDELAEYQRDVKLGDQERHVQKIIDGIAKVPCAWADKTGAMKARDKPDLHENLIPILEQFVTVRFVYLSPIYTQHNI